MEDDEDVDVEGDAIVAGRSRTEISVDGGREGCVDRYRMTSVPSSPAPITRMDDMDDCLRRHSA